MKINTNNVEQVNDMSEKIKAKNIWKKGKQNQNAGSCCAKKCFKCHQA